MIRGTGNEPLKIGDRVRLRQFPKVQGVIWSVPSAEENMVIVKWEDPEENAYVRDPSRRLEKIPKEEKVIRVWPKTMKKPPPRYRIEDTNPGD